MSHVASCTCYECIQNDEPNQQREKISRVITDILTYDTEFLNDWLFHLTVESSAGMFSPMAIQFVETGGAMALVKLMTHAYEKTNTLLPFESNGDNNPDKEYPTYAVMVLSHYLEKNPRACESLLPSLTHVITRCMQSAITTVRRNCLQLLYTIQVEQEAIVMCLLNEISRPRDTLTKELETTNGRVQRVLLQEDEDRQGFSDRYMELTKLDAIRILKLFNHTCVTQQIHALVKQLQVYPHHSLPESTCLYDICEILLLLLHQQPQDILSTVLESFIKLNSITVTSYVYEVHRKATEIGLNYNPKEMEKWGLHLYNSRLAMLTMINHLLNDYDMNKEYMINYALNVLSDQCNDSMIAYIKTSIDNAPYIVNGPCVGPDILGACIITLRLCNTPTTEYKQWMILSAMRYKTMGVECVSRKAYKDAVDMFTIALKVLPSRNSSDAEMLQDEEIQSLVVTLHSNLSEMYIQLKQYDKALSEARESLTINPNHTKSKSREQRVLKLKSL